MDSPEIKKVTEPVDISTSNPTTQNAQMISSSVPTTGNNNNFMTDSSDKSDDSSSLMTDEDGDYDENGSESGSNVRIKSTKTKTRKGKGKKFSNPIIYTSNSSTDSESSISVSPTSVYATMLNANNIVNNSMNVLQSGTRLPNPPTLIEFSGMRFLIMDAPSQSNLTLYLKEMERVGVKDIVRICEPTYPKEIVESFGIKVHDWVFPDGESPPSIIIDSWMSLVDKRKLTVSASASASANANANANANASASTSASSASANGAIAVHCVAGLGRAPVLVAIALIENGMKALDAVSFIRQRRRGAINNKQLKFLESYRPRNSKNDKCLIM